MDLLQLTYFCDAAQTENFSKTAEKYYVPPSNISQTIRRLEGELGVRLFHRDANKITLNENGRLFYTKISRALELIREASAMLENSDGDRRGEIKILIKTNRRIVTHVIELFKELYPLVNFLINHTENGESPEYHFIIDDAEPQFGVYEKHLAMTEEIMLACHREHRLAALGKITVADLKEERFISMTEGMSQYRLMMRICSSAGFTPHVAIQSDDPYYVRKYLEMGLGVAFVPSVAWRGLLPENVVLKKPGEFFRNTYVFCEKKEFMSSAEKLFLTQLLKTFEEECGAI